MIEIIYVTKDNDRLDQLCYYHYKRESGAMEWVMDQNPHLRRLPILLPAGVEINFPPMPEREAQQFFYPWSP